LAHALDRAEFGTWCYRVDAPQLWVSRSLARLYGSEDSTLAVDVASAAVHEDDRPIVVAEARRVLSGEVETFETEHRIITAAGDVRWIRVTGTRYEEADGESILVGTALDVTDRRSAKLAVDQSEQRYRQLVDQAPESIVVFEPRGRRLLDLNPAAERLFGLTRRRLLERDPLAMCPAVQPDGRASHDAAQSHVDDALARQNTRFDWTLRDADGRELNCEVHLATIEIEGRVRLRASFVDVTDRRRLQSVLDQRSRLESLGRLAGGIAHDFNNLLTAIRGHASLALRRSPDDARYVRDLESIERASMRAADLTRQLLVFARQHRVRPKPVELNVRIRDALDMMRPLLPPNVRLKLRLEEHLWAVSIDPNQLEQVVLNLVLNARDALAEGGKITVRTGNLPLQEEDTGYAPGVPVGDWVVLSVSDNGTGMAPDVLDHIFEPFFTTKEQERGTGLGLATCHSIVQHAGGRLLAESEPGMGSIFRAFLPRASPASDAPSKTTTRPVAARPPSGAGTILVVEDESMVREVAVHSLESAGYRVLSAGDAEAALDVARAHDGDVDLLVTDVIMPGLSGPQLARKLLDERPEVPVLYVSGYIHDTARSREQLSPRGAFLPKPYTPDQLGHKVGEMLRRRAEIR